MSDTTVTANNHVTVETEHLQTIFDQTDWTSAATQIGLLHDRVLELEEALQAIVQHQEAVGGGLAVLSTVRRIAVAALASN